MPSLPCGQDDQVQSSSINSYLAFLRTNSKGIPAASPDILISSGETMPLYDKTNGIPPKSKVTVKVIILPSIFPSLMGTSAPSKPMVDPVKVAPSALKVNATGNSPCGPEIDPLHFPSTSAA